VSADTDQNAIERNVRHDCAHYDPPLSDAQTDEAVALAVELYAAAAAHGITWPDADGVTSFPLAAIDGIRSRDRRRR